MSLKVTASASEAERHLRDIVTLAFHNGKLYTGADDGKIKVKINKIYISSIYRYFVSLSRLLLSSLLKK